MKKKSLFLDESVDDLLSIWAEVWIDEGDVHPT